MLEFTSEDDLKTFDGWLKYQGIDAALSSVQELENWRRVTKRRGSGLRPGPLEG